MARTPDTVTWEGTLVLATVTAGVATVSSIASAPRSGPIIPTVYYSDVASIRAGSDAMVTLTGASFTNTMGTTLYESDVALTAADGSSVMLTPDIILDEGTLVVTIPGDTAPGNYNVRAVKDEFASNPTVISIVPAVTITQASRQRNGDHYRQRVWRLRPGLGNDRHRDRHQRRGQASRRTVARPRSFRGVTRESSPVFARSRKR